MQATVCASRSTGKERDTESGNDYFGARYYGSSMGRFLSPDPLMGRVAQVSGCSLTTVVWVPQVSLLRPGRERYSGCANERRILSSWRVGWSAIDNVVIFI